VRIKLSDIARLANVSIATVSYVLNGKGGAQKISQATADRIRKIAREHGYVPNKTARYLKHGRYHLIALIAPHCADFYAGLLRSIELEGDKHEYQILFSSTFDDIEREETYIKNLIARRVDGVVILPIDVHSQHLQYLTRNHVPTIFFRRRADSSSPHKFMTFGDACGGLIATRHLIERGCRRIAFCSSPVFLGPDYLKVIHQARIEGYKQALKEAGREFCPEDVLVLAEPSPSYSEDLVEALKMRGYDGIVGISDRACLPILRSLQANGIRVPEQIKVIGFDNSDYLDFTAPPLSSIRLPKAQLGEAMMQALLRMIETREQEKDEVLLKPDLVERESTRALDSIHTTQDNVVNPRPPAASSRKSPQMTREGT
jgi:LacI family transcriptional regulator